MTETGQKNPAPLCIKGALETETDDAAQLLAALCYLPASRGPQQYVMTNNVPREGQK